jgi:glucan phosphoethanolaminetransferase (alkaline phosphatase superfamily)
MELTDLQNLWSKYDKIISDNTHINKEILKTILIYKTENRINWIRIKAAFNLVLPIALFTTILIPRISFRADLSFIIGGLLFSAAFILIYIWALQYFQKANRIDFKNPIASTKKEIKVLEKYKLKITKLGYLLMPVELIGIFLMAKIPIFSTDSILPFLLIITVMSISIFVTFKYSIIERFNKINQEITDIERLEN